MAKKEQEIIDLLDVKKVRLLIDTWKSEFIKIKLLKIIQVGRCFSCGVKDRPFFGKESVFLLFK